MNKYREALIIMKKELRAYFFSPVAYFVIAVFLLATGAWFFKDFFYFKQAEMRNFFRTLPLLFTLVIPVITMRLFAEEKQSGSIEIVLTMPVRTIDIILGKFFAALIFVALMLVPTLVYLATVIYVGSPDAGPVIGGYLGALLLGGAIASIGIFASSLSKNPIVAVITAWGIGISLWIVDWLVIFLPSKLRFIQYIGTDYHFQNISKGLIDSRDIIYFLSVMILFMLITVKIIDERR